MRIFYFLFLFIFLLTLTCYSQEKPNRGIFLDKLPPEGVLLDKGWKFHSGDNSQWASPTFNDEGWQNLNPTLLYNPEPKFADTISWLRLKLQVSDALRGQQLALSIFQHGASEIYLNGKLIYTFGKVHADANLEVNFNPSYQPIVLPLSQESEQLLAVRFSCHVPGYYKLLTLSAHFLARLYFLPEGWKSYKLMVYGTINSSFIMGIFMIMSVLHFFFYLSNRNKKVNLYFSLYSFLFGFSFVGGAFALIKESVEADFYTTLIFTIAIPLAFIFNLNAVYELFQHKKSIGFRLICICCLAAIISQWIPNYIMNMTAIFGSGFLVTTEIIRITIIALRKRVKIAKLFLLGQALSLLCFSLLGLLSFYMQNNDTTNFMLAVMLLVVDGSFLISPVLLSYILANEFARTNASLARQLKEVERLSAQNLIQEQDKQLLLASQNEILEKQVTERTQDLKNSLQQLQATQAQLIQSEKMASLGELTAGIAHEIQNPLNFVNNFSEVSTELIEELEEDLKSNNTAEALALANDVKENLHKINYHGKRAGSIIQSMLQHSRPSAGERQPTNINDLVKEYITLSYQGMRAKEKSFNANITTDLAPDLEEIEAIPQDLGRVLLNLFNNAFYAVQQKQKQAGDLFKPQVNVSTRKKEDIIEIRIKDNGTGMPEGLKNKIFQPFFTTKPTGQGTGLGLSLSYDIISKGHNGQLKVDTEAGVFTEFTIILPNAAVAVNV